MNQGALLPIAFGDTTSVKRGRRQVAQDNRCPRQNEMNDSMTVLATTTRVVADPFTDDKKPPLPGSPGGDEFIKTLCSFYGFFIHRCCQPRQQWIRSQLEWFRRWRGLLLNEISSHAFSVRLYRGSQ